MIELYIYDVQNNCIVHDSHLVLEFLTPHESIDLEMDTKNPHMAKNLKSNIEEFKNKMYHCYKNIVKHSKKFCSVCEGFLISMNFPPKFQRILCLFIKGKREGNYAYL
jgi:hypothetical protein